MKPKLRQFSHDGMSLGDGLLLIGDATDATIVGPVARFQILDTGGGNENHGSAFGIQVTAQDIHGYTVTTYTGPATVDSSDDANWSSTMPLLMSTGWVNGVWQTSGMVYNVANPSLVLTATDNSNSAITGNLTINVT